MQTAVTVDANTMQALAIIAVAAILLALVWANRQQIAATNFPFLEAIIGKAVFWLIGVVIVVSVATALLSIFGITGQIRVLAPESLFYLALSYAAVSWAKSKA